MKLSQLAAKPQLIKLVLDDQETLDAYGELEFWIYDRQDMDTFVKLATLDHTQFDKIAHIINGMILDEDGTSVVKDGLTLPLPIAMKAIQKVVEVLGKPQKSTTEI
jgi:hypothetical protein